MSHFNLIPLLIFYKKFSNFYKVEKKSFFYLNTKNYIKICLSFNLLVLLTTLILQKKNFRFIFDNK